MAELALLTTHDVARLSGFSTKTVLRAIAAGELAASNVRGEYRIWPKEYRMWIDARRVAGSESPTRTASRRTAGPGSAARLRAIEADP